MCTTILAENIGKFSDLLADCRRILLQIYGIFIHLPLSGYLLNFPPHSLIAKCYPTNAFPVTQIYRNISVTKYSNKFSESNLAIFYPFTSTSCEHLCLSLTNNSHHLLICPIPQLCTVWYNVHVVVFMTLIFYTVIKDMIDIYNFISEISYKILRLWKVHN